MPSLVCSGCEENTAWGGGGFALGLTVRAGPAGHLPLPPTQTPTRTPSAPLGLQPADTGPLSLPHCVRQLLLVKPCVSPLGSPSRGTPNYGSLPSSPFVHQLYLHFFPHDQALTSSHKEARMTSLCASFSRGCQGDRLSPVPSGAPHAPAHRRRPGTRVSSWHGVLSLLSTYVSSGNSHVCSCSVSLSPRPDGKLHEVLAPVLFNTVPPQPAPGRAPSKGWSG